jgi:hypothetical protein
MEYILLAVVVLCLLFTAWREREARLEREELNRLNRSIQSELLTRIQHPSQVLLPVEEKKSAPIEAVIDTGEEEQDDFNLVGSIVEGLPE